MDVRRFLQNLSCHVPVGDWAMLCSRIGAGDTDPSPAVTLLRWLKEAPDVRIPQLLYRLEDRVLIAWASEQGGAPPDRDTAIRMVLARLGGNFPIRPTSGQTPPAPGFPFDPRRAAQPPRPYQVQCLEDLERAIEHAGWTGRHLLEIGTGGGKTRVANDWVRRRVQEHKRILWVTKDWELLRQAAADLCGRYPGASSFLGRVGGDAQLAQLDETTAAQVVYTTIQTWTARWDGDFRYAAFDCVVIDELHWGEGGASYNRLLRRYRDKVIVGLTATPRAWSSFKRAGDAYAFPYLVRENYLARPIVQDPTRTNVRWQPQRSGTEGDFTPQSLDELARNAKRNRLIVSTYQKNQSMFGKTLVFACNVEHANRLARLYQDKGVPAEALHSQMAPADRDVARTRFLANNTRVLVNVAMLTHGVDIPDIQTIFLARPTASDTLFWQMIGRGARLAPDKESFFVVDFVDAVQNHSNPTLDATKILGKLFPPIQARQSRKRSPRLKQWTFSPAKILQYPGRPGYEELRGIEFQPEQTFGIEFELTRKGFEPSEFPEDWDSVAEALLQELRTVLGPSYVAREPVPDAHGSKSLDVWNVEWDGSCGWEVTTRILKGQEGIEEVHDGCQAILRASARLGLEVNYRTGTHVHLGWSPTVSRLTRLVRAAAQFEPALLSLVSPTRASSRYCRPIREMQRRTVGLQQLQDWARAFGNPADRYYALNVRNLFEGYGTVEVRLHNGTQEAKKILTWMSLWMRILEAIQRGRRVPSNWGQPPIDALPLCKGPQGDIARLARFVGAGPELTECLLARRTFVMEHSWLPHPDYGELAQEVNAEWARSAQEGAQRRLQRVLRRLRRHGSR